MRKLETVALNITEEEYRNDGCLHYSTLAKYERGGFEAIAHLDEQISTPSLIFGSAVDALITGGKKEFDNKFFIAETNDCPSSIAAIVKTLYTKYGQEYSKIENIPDKDIITAATEANYQTNWKPETRVKVIKEKGSLYYQTLFLAGDKIIISSDYFDTVANTVLALKSSVATADYFLADNPFDGIERYYQLKFKATLNNVPYSCMADEIIVDYNNKEITPIDLKTTGKPEYLFYKSFLEWNYQIQARLYWRIIKTNLEENAYFKDFKLNNYKFIVVNKDSLQPLVWEFPDTCCYGDLHLGKNKDIILRDPETIGEELKYYLDHKSTLPKDISSINSNNLNGFINKL